MNRAHFWLLVWAFCLTLAFGAHLVSHYLKGDLL